MNGFCIYRKLNIPFTEFELPDGSDSDQDATYQLPKNPLLDEPFLEQIFDKDGNEIIEDVRHKPVSQHMSQH